MSAKKKIVPRSYPQANPSTPPHTHTPKRSNKNVHNAKERFSCDSQFSKESLNCTPVRQKKKRAKEFCCDLYKIFNFSWFCFWGLLKRQHYSLFEYKNVPKKFVQMSVVFMPEIRKFPLPYNERHFMLRALVDRRVPKLWSLEFAGTYLWWAISPLPFILPWIYFFGTLIEASFGPRMQSKLLGKLTLPTYFDSKTYIWKTHKWSW